MGFEFKVDDELSLRLIEPHHAEEIYTLAMANRAHLSPWMVWMCPEACLEDFKRFAEDALIGFAKRTKLELGILRSGTLVGGCGWHGWNHASLFHDHLGYASAEIGYWLCAEHQGLGVMTRVVRALTTLGFETYRLRRLTICAEPDNERSWKVAERLGYRHEGTLRDVARADGRPVDHKLYAMLAEDWAP